MTTRARTAADQLVRLTRLIARSEGLPAHPHPAAPRKLRHNGAELTPPEQQILRRLMHGDYDDHLADLLQLPLPAIRNHRATLRRDFTTHPAPPQTTTNTDTTHAPPRATTTHHTSPAADPDATHAARQTTTTRHTSTPIDPDATHAPPRTSTTPAAGAPTDADTTRVRAQATTTPSTTQATPAPTTTQTTATPSTTQATATATITDATATRAAGAGVEAGVEAGGKRRRRVVVAGAATGALLLLAGLAVAAPGRGGASDGRLSGGRASGGRAAGGKAAGGPAAGGRAAGGEAVGGGAVASGGAFGVGVGTVPSGLPAGGPMPSGVATATSFWDQRTASTLPMSYQTVASPYWPLGTVVQVSYRRMTAVGIVEDFGPARWAVAQHDIPAIIDISEKMMDYLTGSRRNAVHVSFAVLQWGSGPVYQGNGPGYALATGEVP